MNNKKEKTLTKAKQDLQNFYEDYKKRLNKTKEKSREQQEKLIKETETPNLTGTAWVNYILYQLI